MKLNEFGLKALKVSNRVKHLHIDLQKKEVMVSLRKQTEDSRLYKYPVVAPNSLQKWELPTWGWKNLVAAQEKLDPNRELINIEFPEELKKYEESKKKLKEMFVNGVKEDDEIKEADPKEEDVKEDGGLDRRRKKEHLKSNPTQKPSSKLTSKQSSHQQVLKRKQEDNLLEDECEEDKVYLVINKHLLELPANSLKFLKIPSNVRRENGLEDTPEVSEAEIEKNGEGTEVAKLNPLPKLPNFKAEMNGKQQKSELKTRRSKRSASQLPTFTDEPDLEPRTDQKKTFEERKKVVKGVRSKVMKENPSKTTLRFQNHFVFPEGKISECYQQSFEKWDATSKSFVNALQRKEQKARLKELMKGGYNSDYLLHLLHQGINLEDIEKNVQEKEKDGKNCEHGSEFFYHCKPFLSLEESRLKIRSK